jgi:hypothetical protein
VVVLEKNDEAGRKILISGGTRCNVLPASVDLSTDYFTESSASALRAAFSGWTLAECQQWLQDPAQVGIELALEEDTNKLFPASNSAKDVRDRLVSACRRRGVSFVHGAALAGLRRREGGGGGWRGSFRMSGRGEVEIDAERVVLATGGRSFPSLGAEGTGFRLCEAHGHTLHPVYPALTPLLGGHPGGQQLAGISVYDAQLSVAGGKETRRATRAAAGRTSQRSALLLTHRGWSGPAVLDLSHNLVMAQERGLPPPALNIRWARGMDRAAWEAVLGPAAGGGGAAAAGVLRRHGLPARLADALCAEAGLPAGRKVSEMRKAERAALLAALTEYRLPASGHEGYAKAEVTGGGVPLNELDCATLESRKMEGVHVCGELCDVHGRIGGFNFFWAWCSGRSAGLGAAAAAAR